jgi:hypothetical protein
MVAKTEEFVRLIDQALAIAEQTIRESNQTEHLHNLIAQIQSIKTKVQVGQLEPSTGIINLGLVRDVADWIEPLSSPLLSAVGAIERYYQENL